MSELTPEEIEERRRAYDLHKAWRAAEDIYNAAVKGADTDERTAAKAAEDAYLECPGDSLLEDDDGNAVLCAVTGIPIYDTDDYEQKFEFRSAKKIEEAD